MLDLVGATLKLDVKGIVAPKKCAHLNVVVNGIMPSVVYITKEVVSCAIFSIF